MNYYPRNKKFKEQDMILTELRGDLQDQNQMFFEMLQNEDFDKQEFTQGKKILHFRKKENYESKKRLYDIFTPKHFFLNSLENKADDKMNYSSSKGFLTKLAKQQFLEKIKDKMKKKKKLNDKEKKFFESEGIQSPEQRSLAEVIRKHKSNFNLEKYTKLREKIKEMITKTQLKREEKQKKIIFKKNELGFIEAQEGQENKNIKNPEYIDLLNKSMKKNRQDLKIQIMKNNENTMKVMNIIQEKVEEEIERNRKNIRKVEQYNKFGRFSTKRNLSNNLSVYESKELSDSVSSFLKKSRKVSGNENK